MLIYDRDGFFVVYIIYCEVFYKMVFFKFGFLWYRLVILFILYKDYVYFFLRGFNILVK